MLLHEALKDRRIVLGSASPRRRELLAGLGLDSARPLPAVGNSLPDSAWNLQ